MNILVLDDEAKIADLVELFLKNEGYNVYKFYSSSEAIKCINSTPLDLALLDVMLPDTDGFTILRTIREEGYRFPVIMLTAKVEITIKLSACRSALTIILQNRLIRLKWCQELRLSLGDILFITAQKYWKTKKFSILRA